MNVVACHDLLLIIFVLEVDGRNADSVLLSHGTLLRTMPVHRTFHNHSRDIGTQASGFVCIFSLFAAGFSRVPQFSFVMNFPDYLSASVYKDLSLAHLR
jgi:hypothetical protein